MTGYYRRDIKVSDRLLTRAALSRKVRLCLRFPDVRASSGKVLSKPSLSSC